MKTNNEFKAICIEDDHRFRRVWKCTNVPNEWTDNDVISHIIGLCYPWGTSVRRYYCGRVAYVTEYID